MSSAVLFFCFCLEYGRLGPYTKLCLALSISIKIYLESLLYHHHLQVFFFNWNITSSPYLEMLPINMIKLLFLLFFSDRNV